MKYGRLRWAAAILVALAILVVWFSGSMRRAGDPGAPRRQPSRPASVAAAVPRAEPAPSAARAALPPAMRTLRMIDAVSGQAVPGIAIRWEGGSGDGGTVIADAAGQAAVPRLDGGLVIRAASDGYAILRPAGGRIEDVSRDEPVGSAVHVLRTRRVVCRVSAEGMPEGDLPADLRILGGVVEKRADDWYARPDDAGSSAWIEREAPTMSRVRAVPAGGGVFHITLPRTGEVAVVAFATGFVAACETIAADAGQDPVDLHLRRAPLLRIAVHGVEGVPLPEARVRVLAHRVTGPGGFNAHVEELIAGATGAGLGMCTAENSGEWRSAIIATGTMGPAEAFEVRLPVERERIDVVVHHPGYRARRIAWEARQPGSDVIVTLDAIRPLVESYRLTRAGRALADASVELVRDLDWVNTFRFIEHADATGRISAGNIEPGERYSVTVRDGAATFAGRIRFGDEPEIDLSHFRE